jgi:hypothetical protein
LPADTRAAAKVWNDAMADLIQDTRQPAATGLLAHASRKGPAKTKFIKSKWKKLAGTTGLEPATSDVTGRGLGGRIQECWIFFSSLRGLR